MVRRNPKKTFKQTKTWVVYSGSGQIPNIYEKKKNYIKRIEPYDTLAMRVLGRPFPRPAQPRHAQPPPHRRANAMPLACRRCGVYKRRFQRGARPVRAAEASLESF